MRNHVGSSSFLEQTPTGQGIVEVTQERQRQLRLAFGQSPLNTSYPFDLVDLGGGAVSTRWNSQTPRARIAMLRRSSLGACNIDD